MSEFVEPKKPVGNVAELFAGVGGFRIGLARAGWKTTFSNQWEPATKAQPASDVYVYRFGDEGHFNQDIAKVLDECESGTIQIPDIDLLVGGFPCQDYSVAKSLNSSAGLVGKKGVLWWEILRLVRLSRPPLILLENVDRLLKSPAKQRGRDFGVMLASLADEGYSVEWRVVNAADYGANQRRKRVFIVAKREDIFARGTKWNAEAHLLRSGTFAKALPVVQDSLKQGKGISKIDSFDLIGDLEEISNKFGETKGISRFLNAGVIVGRKVVTMGVEPQSKASGSLGSVIQDLDEVDDAYLIPKAQLPSWKYLKGAKKEPRRHAASGAEYFYAEGKMAFPDLLTNPSRTILTGEGGTSASRFKHIIEVGSGRYRRLTPIELERLNGFPDDWTRFTHNGEVTDSKRAFFMGNALVVDLVAQIGNQLASEYKAIRRKKPS